MSDDVKRKWNQSRGSPKGNRFRTRSTRGAACCPHIRRVAALPGLRKRGWLGRRARGEGGLWAPRSGFGALGGLFLSQGFAFLFCKMELRRASVPEGVSLLRIE